MLKKLIDIFNHRIEKMEETIITYMLLFISCVVMLQIIMRYVFNNSLTWSEELSTFVMMWMTWVACSYAVKKNMHLRVTLFIDMLKGKWRSYAYILIDIVWFVFSVYMVVMGSKMVQLSYRGGRVSPALQVPMYFIYSSVIVGCLLMCLSLISSIFKRTSESREMNNK